MVFLTDEDKYIVARWCYSIADPIMEDIDYMNLHRMIISKNLLPEYTARSWSSDPCPVEILKKYGMQDKIYAVVLGEKTQSIESITSEAELESTYKNATYPRTISIKRDGFNTQLTYRDGKRLLGNSRGRKSDVIIFDNIGEITPDKIDTEGTIHIIGEVTLSTPNFVQLCRMYPEKNLKSQRSAVRTALVNKEATHLLTFSAFRIMEEPDVLKSATILERWGFNTPRFDIVKSYEDLLNKIKFYDKLRESDPEPSDGLVVTDMMNTHQRAIRLLSWAESVLKSYITGYEIGKDRFNSHTISVNVLIKPIKLKNSTQRRIPVTNLRRVIENNLRKGYPIAFTLTSDAAPVLDENNTKILQRQYDMNEQFYRDEIDLIEIAKAEGALL